MDVKEKLQTRLHIHEPMLGVMVDVIEQNGISLDIRNLATGSLVLFDEKNRRVGFSYAKQIGKGSYELESLDSTGDVVIVVYKDFVLGWLKVSEVNDKIFHQGLLQSMPDDFDFSIECLHLPDNGGYTIDYEKWVCFGCGKELVFSDKKR